MLLLLGLYFGCSFLVSERTSERCALLSVVAAPLGRTSANSLLAFSARVVQKFWDMTCLMELSYKYVT